MSFENLDINAPDHWAVNSLIHRHQERLRSIQLWIKCERSGLAGQRLPASKQRRNGSIQESEAYDLPSLLGDRLDLKLLE